jgi:hypothetical protein
MREENPSSTSNLIYHEEGREYFPVHLQLDSHLLLLHSQMNPCINPFPCASILPLPLSLFGTRQEKWTAPRVRLGGSAPKPKPSALCSSTLSEFLASGVPLFQNVAGIGCDRYNYVPFTNGGTSVAGTDVLQRRTDATRSTDNIRRNTEWGLLDFCQTVQRSIARPPSPVRGARQVATGPGIGRYRWAFWNRSG